MASTESIDSSSDDNGPDPV